MKVCVRPDEDLVEWFERRGVALNEEDRAACIHLNIFHVITIPTFEEDIRRNKENVYFLKKHIENNEVATANLKQKLISCSYLLDLAEGESVSECVNRGISQYANSISAYIPACRIVLTSLESLTNTLLDFVEPGISPLSLPDLPAIRAICESEAKMKDTLKNVLASLQNEVSWCVDFVNSRALANVHTERDVFGRKFPFVTGSVVSDIFAMHNMLHDSKLARLACLAKTPSLTEMVEIELRSIHGDIDRLRALNSTGSEDLHREESELCVNVSKFRIFKRHTDNFKCKISRAANLSLDCDVDFV